MAEAASGAPIHRDRRRFRAARLVRTDDACPDAHRRVQRQDLPGQPQPAGDIGPQELPLSRRPAGTRRPCRASGGQRHARGAAAPRRHDGLPCGDHLCERLPGGRQDPIADRAPPADCPRGTDAALRLQLHGVLSSCQRRQCGLVRSRQARTGPDRAHQPLGLPVPVPRRQRSSGDLQPVRLAGPGARS